MKITILGSSHGVPEPTRFCTCILVEADGHFYLIDGGAPTASLLRARGMTPTDIEAAFVTHSHGDHFNGLIEMIDLETWFFRDAHTRFLFPEASLIPAVNGLLQATHGGNPPREIPMENYQEGTIWDDGHLKVTAIRSRHMPEPHHTYGFLLETEGKRVLFTGDMCSTFEDFPRPEGQLDLAFCEAAHCKLENALPILAQTPTKQMIFYHIAPVNFHLPALNLPFPIAYAEDGSEYIL